MWAYEYGECMSMERTLDTYTTVDAAVELMDEIDAFRKQLVEKLPQGTGVWVVIFDTTDHYPILAYESRSV